MFVRRLETHDRSLHEQVAHCQRRTLAVTYAWQRRASDSGPALGQKGPASNRTPLDQSAAQRIAERMIPDVLTAKDRTAGEPYIVLSAKGEVIAAGRLKIDRSVAKRFDDIIREGFDLPDFWGSDFETVRLRNNLGEQADVIFAWDLPEETKARLKEAAPQ